MGEAAFIGLRRSALRRRQCLYICLEEGRARGVILQAQALAARAGPGFGRCHASTRSAATLQGGRVNASALF